MKSMRIMKETETKKVNGGAVTATAVAGGLVLAWGTVEAARGFVNKGIDLGNKIFKNNAKHI